MICQRCQRTLRSNDGLKCSICDSKFHLKCVSVSDCDKGIRECGDRGYHWKCALCHSSVNKIKDISNSKESLIVAVNVLTEKLELVSKIQLPKLNGELSQIKSAAERIAKQNDDILRKIDEFEKKQGCEKRASNSRSYRRRSWNITQRSSKAVESNEYKPMQSVPEKPARYRTRRRSYLLNSMFHLLNRKPNRNNISRKRH